MKLSTALMLVAAIVLVSGSGGAGAQTPRPTPSLEGPLPVTMTGEIGFNPGTRWPVISGAPAVWVAGATPPAWSYKYLCLAGSPDNWTQLGEDGRGGWELVGQAGVACTEGSRNGQWFILKKPGATAK